jgi:hypothetical protein
LKCGSYFRVNCAAKNGYVGLSNKEKDCYMMTKNKALEFIASLNKDQFDAIRDVLSTLDSYQMRMFIDAVKGKNAGEMRAVVNVFTVLIMA